MHTVRGALLPIALLTLLTLGACKSSEPEQAQVAAPAPPQQTEYSAEQIKAAMRKHIATRTELGNPGVFEITDPRTSQVLNLQFIKIHDPVRSLGNGRYFACTDFHVVGQPGKTFDLDFWLMPFKGELVAYQENVHKLPIRKDGEWVQQPRYTFVDNQPSLLR